MYSFKNDYSEGCHPRILDALAKTNLEQQDGYGEDTYSTQAKEIIKNKIQYPDAKIYFVSGGTQANLIVIASMLRPYESVISAESGHINVHEAGAIESTGHKIHSIPNPDGKVTVDGIRSILKGHIQVPHMVKPRLVYISNATEIGTIYGKTELEQLIKTCRENNLILFLDGARLGSALCAEGNDLAMVDLSRMTDVFYIGGTKNGALLGEAIVINNSQLQKDFEFHLKQRGALLSKGRILGIQFLELFMDDLFFDLAKHANAMAGKIVEAMKEKGIKFLTNSTTNQIFPILSNHLIERLAKKHGFYVWQKVDEENSAIRLVTSWATQESAIDEFIADLDM